MDQHVTRIESHPRAPARIQAINATKPEQHKINTAGRASHAGDSSSMFCCCEFVDRHGQLKHLADASVCDDLSYVRLSLAGLRAVLLDCDDRIRFPMHGGARYIGLHGIAALLFVGAVVTVASRKASSRACLAISFALFTASYLAQWRGSRTNFFAVTLLSITTYVYVKFTLLIGKHIFFFLWLLVTVSLGVFALYVHLLISGLPHRIVLEEQSSLLHERCQTATGGDELKAQLADEVSPGRSVASELASKTTRRCSFCCTEVACHHYYSVWFDACFDGQSSGTVAVAIGAFLLVGIITAATTLMRIAVIAKDVTWAELLLHSHSASSSSAREEMALLQCTFWALQISIYILLQHACVCGRTSGQD